MKSTDLAPTTSALVLEYVVRASMLSDEKSSQYDFVWCNLTVWSLALHLDQNQFCEMIHGAQNPALFLAEFTGQPLDNMVWHNFKELLPKGKGR